MSLKLYSAIFIFTFSISISLFAQIEVTDQTVKIDAGAEESLYFGFAEGDQLIFNFEEKGGKDLKEIEIIEYPSNSKFAEFKTSKIAEKKIQVQREGVYQFRFYNGHVLAGRICKVHIQRVPKGEEAKSFNTSIDWQTVTDTTWNSYTKDVVIGYDTLRVQKTRRILIKTDTIEEIVMNKVERSHSVTNSNGNKTSVFFSLPQNLAQPLESKEVVAWAYWVGVGDESNAAWQKNSEAIKKSVSGVAALTLTPIGALAAGLVTDLMLPTIGEDVSYGLLDQENYKLKAAGYEYRGFDFGKGIAGYKRFTQPFLQQGMYYITLENDNYVQGIDVNLKVSALIVHKLYKNESYTDLKITPIIEKQIFRDPVVKSRKEPILMH